MSCFYDVYLYGSTDSACYSPFYATGWWFGMRECKLQSWSLIITAIMVCYADEKILHVTQLDTNWLFLRRLCAL